MLPCWLCSAHASDLKSLLSDYSATLTEAEKVRGREGERVGHEPSPVFRNGALSLIIVVDPRNIV